MNTPFTVLKARRLDNVRYDIRGPVVHEAQQLEEAGHSIIKLNIGNPAPFGLNAPDEIVHDVARNLRAAQGYSDSKGLLSARKAVMHYCQQRSIDNVDCEDIFLGDGVSEMIIMAMQALLNDGDEMLVPAPDYPLWTAAVRFAGGKACHYLCDEQSNWYPDIQDIEKKITAKTRGIVLINPNNPTGALYPVEILNEIIRVSRKHNLIIFSDEIYDKILYDDAVHTSIAALANDLVFVTFNGLSKTYQVAGFRSGWMVISGAKHRATDFMDGLTILSSMRLCANVPAQYAIQTALGDFQSIARLIGPEGRLYEQRELFYNRLVEIPGITCVKPQGALYLFPKLDKKRFNITNDRQFALDLLRQEKVLVVEGSAFSWTGDDHFRVVILPPVDEIKIATHRLANFLSNYRQ